MKPRDKLKLLRSLLQVHPKAEKLSDLSLGEFSRRLNIPGTLPLDLLRVCSGLQDKLSEVRSMLNEMLQGLSEETKAKRHSTKPLTISHPMG